MPPLAQLEALDVVRALVSHDVAGWGRLDPTAVAVERTDNTEWHAVFFVTAPESECQLEHHKMVVNVPSWTGATLANKAAASAHLEALGIGPAVVAEFETELPLGSGVSRRVHACEWLGGGELLPEELQNPTQMAALGALYSRLHNSGVGTGWFGETLRGLKEEGRMAEDDAGDWASCDWVLSWLLSLVPEDNRATLTEKGVDFDFISAEIAELRASPLLPATPTVTVHGDSHLGNVMHVDVGDNALRLIDFDLTAPGPAGSEFGFIVLMLFRCGFAPELVLQRHLQREFASAYLGGRSSPQQVDELLLTMHLWAYFGLLKMGLLCAVLMNNEGHERKREVMHLRGPVLLHAEFLRAAKRCMEEAQAGAGDTREDLLARGLFFVAEDAWKSASGAKQ
jgi:hypothetical protein